MRGSLLQLIIMHFIGRLLSTMRLRELLPGACTLCGAAGDAMLCDHCLRRHLLDPVPRCRCCAIDVPAMHARCGRCSSEPPAFDASYAATHYAPPVDELVHALKFRAQLPHASLFARLLLQAVPRDAVAADALVIAVPLSAERLASRGFNQAHEIAKPLARAWRLPLATDACIRVRDTEEQSTLAFDKRRDNMRGAFAVARREAIAGRQVLVVDDVMTTGHTLAALAACLKRNGATRVTNLVFARTPLR